MPAKITLNTTDNQSGEISVSDIHKMLTDFKTKVNISCSDPARNPVVKRFHFDINIDRIKLLTAGTNTDKNLVRISLSLNMPSQLNCENSESIENHISIILSGVNKVNKTSQLSPGYAVLLDGFKDNEDYVVSRQPGDDCCVQGSPIVS